MLRQSVRQPRKVFELNGIAHFVLSSINGRRTAEQLAMCVVDEFDASYDQVWQDVVELLAQFEDEKLVERIDAELLVEKEAQMADDTSLCYIKNPDVVLREEDADGALLFSPDTDQLKVINTTGLFVWELCDGKHTVQDIVAALTDEIDDLPDEAQAVQDVKEFINVMLNAGFVGVAD